MPGGGGRHPFCVRVKAWTFCFWLWLALTGPNRPPATWAEVDTVARALAPVPGRIWSPPRPARAHIHVRALYAARSTQPALWQCHAHIDNWAYYGQVTREAHV